MMRSLGDGITHATVALPCHCPVESSSTCTSATMWTCVLGPACLTKYTDIFRFWKLSALCCCKSVCLGQKQLPSIMTDLGRKPGRVDIRSARIDILFVPNNVPMTRTSVEY